jgi:hypothetical protein
LIFFDGKFPVANYDATRDMGHHFSAKSRCIGMRIILAIGVGFVCLAPPALGSSLLVSLTQDQEDMGYDQFYWQGMTADLNADASSILTVSDLSNLNQLLGYDGIWIDLRQSQTGTLSAIESANLATYINTGRRVVMMGDNATNFASWDAAILNIAGGTVSPNSYTGVTSTESFVPLTTGVNNIYITNGGVTTTGSTLFQDRAATMWGPANNVLVVLDDYAFSDASLPKNYNSRFASNVAAWITGGLSDIGCNWAHATSGSWANGSSWVSAAMPNNGDDTLFNLGSTSDYTVSIGSTYTAHSVTIKADHVTFDLSAANAGLAIGGALSVGQINSGSGTLSLNASGGNGFISAGNLAIAGVAGGSGNVNVGGNVTLAITGSTVNDTAGVIDITGTANLGVITGGGNITVESDGKLAAASIRQSSLTVNGTTTVTPRSSSTNASSILSILSSLTITGSTNAWTGTLDLNNNDLIIHHGDLATTTNQIKSGFNAQNGYWNGAGIRSTAAANDPTHLTALGIAMGTTGGSFDNQFTTNTDVLVKFTYYGDANLDGQVNGNDYTLIDTGYGGGGTGWQFGDFNYDGHIDGSDYSLIDNAFNRQNAVALNDQMADETAEVSAITSVPEPAMSVLCLAGSLATRIRRSDKNTGRGSTELAEVKRPG